MNYKIMYIISFIIFLLIIIGFFFFRERILFTFYGYSQALIDSQSVESFEAYKRIAFGKKVFLGLAFIVSLGFCLLSQVAKGRKDVHSYLSNTGFYISLVISVILLIGIILSFFIPKRII